MRWVTYAIRAQDLPADRCLVYRFRYARSNITTEERKTGEVFEWGGLQGPYVMLVEHLPK